MRTFSIHLVRNTLIAFLFVAGLGAAYYFNSSVVKPTPADAGTAQNISGWAWSDSYGWISLNSIDCDKDNNLHKDVFCGGDNLTGTIENYGVNVNTTNRTTGGTGNFSGYAWSDNAGWITFDQAKLGGCPSGSCVAEVNWGTGFVTGWARACIGTVAGDCTGATAPGWDGWIKLGGDGLTWNGSACVGVNDYLETNRCNYGVKITGGKISGHAWGSSTPGAMGWVDFAPTINGVPIGGQVAAPPCVAPVGGYNPADPTMIWGSCNPTAVCGVDYPVGSGTHSGIDGVVVGACTVDGVPTGGTTVVACPAGATLICPAAVPPTTTKTRWWQF